YIKQNKECIDGICLGLHGAGVSESIDDLETDVLRAIRRVVGDDIPITVTLDLHGNLTQEMAGLTQGLFGVKENPHTDYAVSGYEAMSTLINAIEHGVRAKTSVKPIPVLMPISQNIDGELNTVKEYFNTYKADHELLDAAFFHGFPYADGPHVSSSVFVTAYENSEYHAEVLANYLIERKERLSSIYRVEPEEAIDLALTTLSNEKEGYVVLNESSDNPGGGAPGDGTQLLREMLERDIPGSAFGYIYDPQAVQVALKAGVGNRVSVDLGGKIEESHFHGEPISLIDAVVCSISEGHYQATTPLMKGIHGTYGPTVCLRSGNVEIVVCSVQNQTYDDTPFVTAGVDLSQKRLVALKSSQHFKAFYKDRAITTIEVNTNGVNSNDLTSFYYKNIRRPIYPLDKF
ncbi:MlrC C-terminal domain-containing protein, partial [Photobacterium sanctipauli]